MGKALTLLLSCLMLASFSFAWTAGYAPPSCVQQYSLNGMNFSYEPNNNAMSCSGLFLQGYGANQGAFTYSNLSALAPTISTSGNTTTIGTNSLGDGQYYTWTQPLSNLSGNPVNATINISITGNAYYGNGGTTAAAICNASGSGAIYSIYVLSTNNHIETGTVTGWMLVYPNGSIYVGNITGTCSGAGTCSLSPSASLTNTWIASDGYVGESLNVCYSNSGCGASGYEYLQLPANTTGTTTPASFTWMKTTINPSATGQYGSYSSGIYLRSDALSSSYWETPNIANYEQATLYATGQAGAILLNPKITFRQYAVKCSISSSNRTSAPPCIT